ncbi:MAG: hypothetical protein ACRDJW_08460 [Thermomicrobiales bacterium]
MSRISPIPHTPVAQPSGHTSRRDVVAPREEESVDHSVAGHSSQVHGTSVPRSAVVALQRTHGNTHVQRVLRIQRDPEDKALEAAKADATAAQLSVAALHKLAASRDRAMLRLGTTKEGRDVNAFVFKGAISDVALVIAGVHGSELSGVEVAEKLIQRLGAKGAPRPFFTVVIVPQLFPDNVAEKRAWEKSQKDAWEKVGKDVEKQQSAYQKARNDANDPGRFTTDRRHGASREPNRQFPELGKPFDPKNPVDANGRPIEHENIMLLTLIDRFKPTRIVALHAIKSPKDAGIYADPHPALVEQPPYKGGLTAAQKGLAHQADELAKLMAEAAKKKGAKVPGNWRDGTFTSLYPNQDPKISAERMKRENKAGRSLGQWGPSQGAVVITVELNEQYASDSPVEHPGRTKEIEAHAEALKEVFVGPSLAAFAVEHVWEPTIERLRRLRQMLLGPATQPAGPARSPRSGDEVQRFRIVGMTSAGTVLARQSAPAAGTTKHYTLQSGVTLSAAVEKKVAEIADDYYADRKKDIVVTSGTRTASSQASAMYTKLEAGDDIVKLYKNKTAVKEIKKAYDDGKAAKKSRTEIVDAMTAVIETQIKAGTYISKHLRAGAVDVRSKDMTADDKKAFRKAAKGKATKVILETKPPHWHLQF